MTQSYTFLKAAKEKYHGREHQRRLSHNFNFSRNARAYLLK
jgi:hypothetical protein